MTVMSKNLVVVAMSGGVDSSVAALLLKEQGMEVIGISMKLHSLGPAEPDPRLNRGEIPLSPRYPASEKTCCSVTDINDARRVCQQLDIPFYPMNFTDEFHERVVEYFGREYAQGRTPNPCVACNEQMKFSSLLKEARQLGAYYLATGHYAQKNRDRYGRYHLTRAKDRSKDQTYFLFGLGQGELEHVLFPVGKYSKDEVREFARAAGLKTADKEESQEICFVPDNDYASFIEKQLPQHRGQRGEMVAEDGQPLGEHRGIHAYTIGQRRGLGVASGERLYVNEIRPEENKVVLGSKQSLLMQGLVAQNVRWVNRELAEAGMKVEAKIRYRHRGVQAYLWIINETTARLDFLEPEGPVTPGQAAVFYHGDEVIGGGWIEKGVP